MPESRDTEARICRYGAGVSSSVATVAFPSIKGTVLLKNKLGISLWVSSARKARGRKEPAGVGGAAGRTAAGGGLGRIHARFPSWLGQWASGPEDYKADFSGTGWDENKLA